MNIMLGNLTIEEIQQRAGVEFPPELIEFMKENHQPSADNVKTGKWHCFDIPFSLVCGHIPTAQKIYNYIKDKSSSFKEPLQIALSK